LCTTYWHLQNEESKLEGVSGLVEALPDYLVQAASTSAPGAAAAATSAPRGVGGKSKKDTSFSTSMSVGFAKLVREFWAVFYLSCSTPLAQMGARWLCW